MHKVLIYTDLHCSYNSSILPLYDEMSNSKFTTRLKMIINTGRWLSELAEREHVDCIINGGDTFDSTNVRAEELEAIKEFFTYFEKLNIPHYVIVGNHEKVNDKFNASEILSGYKNVIVVKEPKCLNDQISFLPYMESNKITEELLKSIESHLLVSHIDIQGSCLRGSYILDSGVLPESLANHFKFVANGHLHTAEHLETSKNQVWNIGGVSSISFVDNQEYIPSAIVYDFEYLSGSFERFLNPYAILFRKLSVNSLEDLILKINNLDQNFRYAVTIKYSNYEQKSVLQQVLESDPRILAYKMVNGFSQTSDGSNSIPSLDISSLDLNKKFEEFLDTIELKYSKEEYLNLLKEDLE